MTSCLLDSGAGLDAHQLRTQVLLGACAHGGNRRLCHLRVAVTAESAHPSVLPLIVSSFCCSPNQSGLLEPVGQVEPVSAAVLEEGFQSRPPGGPSQLSCCSCVMLGKGPDSSEPLCLTCNMGI